MLRQVAHRVDEARTGGRVAWIEIGRDLESSVFGVERAATLAVILMLLAIAMMWIYRTLQRRGERIL